MSADNNARPPRADPFGQRYLRDESTVFEYNAWDNVDWPEEQEILVQKKIEEQKSEPVDEVEAETLIVQPSSQWENFYTTHENNFFKDRKWLTREFPELFVTVKDESTSIKVLDVGCGVGNTTFPLLQANNNLYFYSCDFSSAAIEILKQSPLYDSSRCTAFVWDITESTDAISPGSLDFILCIYVLSAIPPKKHDQAIRNLVKLLKPGGAILLKDYGRYDLTQLRFKSNRFIDENFYCRGDGTLVYFFTSDELHDLFVSAGLNKKENKKLLLKLCCETLKYRPYLEKILNSSGVRKVLKHGGIDGNRNLVLVLLYEFLLGQSFAKVGNPLKSSILAFESEIRAEEAHLAEIGQTPDNTQTLSVSNVIPRYVRINTVLTTTEHAIEKLEELGWRVSEIKLGASMKKLKKKIQKMDENRVYKDPHIEDLLIFRPGTDLHDCQLVLDGKLVLQDKASCLSAFILNPPPSSTVFDVCAAPGMKTSHLAAIMQNRGKIFAFDRDRNRVVELENTLDRLGATIAHATNIDFLKVDINEKRFTNVKYAVVDPPCSGTGMAKRLDFIETQNDVDEKRLKSLGNLQSMILKHALKLPNLERLVYSTCSVHETENEKVIEEAINDPSVFKRFELVKILPDWEHRGLSTYEFGEQCIRADPQTDLTNGFFVALFVAKS